MDLYFAVFVFFSTFIACNGYDHFGYSPEEQEAWATKFPECGGIKQSPIHIHTEQTSPVMRKPLIFKGYDRVLPLMQLWNDGHTIDLAIHPDVNTEKIQIPTISGGNLGAEYEFIGMHFHWGRNNNVGGEHIIDDLSSPMELHIAHKKVSGSSGSGTGEGNEYMVIGVLYRLQRWDGFELLPIFRRAMAVRTFNSSIPILPDFSLGTFLGNINTNLYYEYNGSLTTPPCTESAAWVVFRERLVVSERQLNQLRKLETVDENGNPIKMIENHRQVQPLNNRIVNFNLGTY